MEQKNNKKVKIILIVLVLIVAISLISIGLISYFNSKVTGKNDLGLGSETPIGNVNQEVIEAVQEGRNLQNELKNINATYTDAACWLKIPGTNVDTPVFKSKDNDRYLRHDRDNKKTKWGETFLDFRSDVNNMDNMSHFIIYGHNTETNDHFTPILNYKKKDFFKNHQIIEMSTLKGNYKWQVFTVYVTDSDFFYIDTKFADKTEYGEFLKTLKSKSLYDTNINISGDDTLLTLSTCDYSLKNGRFVVQAKLVK
ncbi:MAG: class B sortase [Clostridia bacterium]